MGAVHAFYEGVMGFELITVEIAPVIGGGWGKHFFYRMDGDDSKFIAFWELHDVPGQENHEFDLNKAAKTPPGTNHISFDVGTAEELKSWRKKWNAAGHDVLEINHNWCHSIYTRDPNNNMVEFCLTTGNLGKVERERALAALDEKEMKATPPPATMKQWLAVESDK